MKVTSKFFILVVTSVICLLPMIFSLAVYSELPEQIAIHWNSAGEPNNFASKAVAAFGLPIMFLAINIFSKMRLYNDPKRLHNTHSKAIQMLSEWTPPVMSVVLVPMTLYIAMGASLSMSIFAPIVVGILLVVCGNYLPKCRQNYTIGIKLPWTLHDIDNWNKTHRLAGYLWIVVGVIFIVWAFISDSSIIWGGPILVLLAVIVPTIYSYLLYIRMSEK